MKEKSFQTGIYIVLVILFALNLGAVIFDIKQLWGINIAKFLPTWWQGMIFLIIAISFIPTISKKLGGIFDNLSVRIAGSGKQQTAFLIVFSVTFFIFCLIYFAQTKFLGDGYLRIRQISTGKFWLPTEIGDFYIHAAFFRYILEPLGEDAIALSYHIISALCGVAFVIGVFRLALYLKSSQSVMLFLVMFSSGMTVMFFGYVESYSILAAMIPFIILTALKVIDGRSSILKLIILFLLAVLFHSVSLVILSGLLIAVIVICYNESIVRARRLLRWLGMIVAAGIILLYIGRATNIIDTGVYLLPLFPSKGYAMGFFTLHHLSNLFNWFILSALAGVPIWLSLAHKRLKNLTDRSKRRIMLAFFMLVPPAIFMLFFAPQLSGPRDWDLFSLATFMFMPAGLIMFMAKNDRPLPFVTIPAIFLAMGITFSLAGVNGSVIRSCDRFEEIIEVARYKNLYKEYSTLYNLSTGMPVLYGRQLRYAHKAWDEPPYNKYDSVYITSQLADIYFENDNKFMARKFISHLFTADSANLGGHLFLMHYYRKFNEQGNLPKLAERMARLFPDSAVGLMNAAVIFLQVNQFERGRELMQRAYDLDSTNISIIENYATLQYRLEHYERCIELADRLIEKDRLSFTAHYHTAAAYFKLNDIAQSAEYLSKAERLAKSSEEAGMVQNLKQALGSQ
jgi:hypothetical protein